MVVVLLLALPFIRLIPPHAQHLGEAKVDSNQAGDWRGNLPAWLALVAFLIFFAGVTGLWAFLERVGKEISIEPGQMGIMFAVLKLIGGAASIVPVVLASRFGLHWPHIVGFAGVLAGVILLHHAETFTLFAAGSWIWEFAQTLIFCYAPAAITRLDRSGRVSVLIPMAIGVGGTFGPAVAGLLNTGDSYIPIYAFATLCTLISTLIFMALMSPLFAEKHAAPASEVSQ